MQTVVDPIAAPSRRLLLVSADEADALLVARVCRESGHLGLDWVRGPAEARPVLGGWTHDAILADWNLGGVGSALDLLTLAAREGFKAPVILLANVSSRPLESQVFEAGASDLLVKGRLDADWLERAVAHGVARHQAAKRLRVLERVAAGALVATGPDAALGAALAALTTYTRWSSGLVWSVTADGRLLEAGLRAPPGARPQGAEPVFLAPGEGLAGRALAEGRRVVAEAGEAVVEAERLAGPPPRSAVALPVRMGEAVQAVLTLFSDQPLDEERLLTDLLEQVAGQLGQVLEREHSRQALRDKEELLERILGTSTDGIVMLERTGRVGFANPAARLLLGLGPRATGGPARGLAAIPFHEILQRGRPVRDVDARVVAADGTERVLAVSGAPLRAGDTVQGVVAVLRDVTEARAAQAHREALEGQLRQAQKMEAVGRLAGGVAHDFNNLLTTITGLIDLVLPSLAEDDPRREDLETVQQSSLKASDLTRQLLVFSRGSDAQPVVLDLGEQLAALERLGRRILGPEVELELSLPEDPVPVRADPTQLDQVVLNLLINARDAMPQGGRVRVSLAPVELGPRRARELDLPPGPVARLLVSDTGEGMDEATRARIFEPFFTTKADKGTGLGLSTVYGIVTGGGGHIDVASRPGRGTTFRLHLPLAEGAVLPRTGATSAPEPAAPTEARETILLVEDEDAIRRLATRTLEDAGYRVLGARDGTEALSLAGRVRDRVHLLLTDLVMPWMSGRELADALVDSLPGLRVVYMSGHPPATLSQHGLDPRRVDFLEKPFRLDDLLTTVRTVLDRPEPRSDREARHPA